MMKRATSVGEQVVADAAVGERAGDEIGGIADPPRHRLRRVVVEADGVADRGGAARRNRGDGEDVVGLERLARADLRDVLAGDGPGAEADGGAVQVGIDALEHRIGGIHRGADGERDGGDGAAVGGFEDADGDQLARRLSSGWRGSPRASRGARRSGSFACVAVAGGEVFVRATVAVAVAVAVDGPVVSVACGVAVAVAGGTVFVGALVSVARGVLVAVPGGFVLVGALVAVLTGCVAVAGGLVAVGTPAVAVGRGLLSSLEPQAVSRSARTAAASSRMCTVETPSLGA